MNVLLEVEIARVDCSGIVVCKAKGRGGSVSVALAVAVTVAVVVLLWPSVDQVSWVCFNVQAHVQSVWP